MRVLVTGASGFIGLHVTRLLSQSGHHVIALHRRNDAGAHDGVPDAAENVILDLASPRPGSIAAIEPEACIHLAWHARPPTYLVDVPRNVASAAATLWLLEELVNSSCRRFVFAGSCLEDAPVKTIYAAAKRSVHQLLPHLGNGMTTVCAHIFNVYGPGEHPGRLIPTLVRALSTQRPVDAIPGDEMRHYVFVEDVASALKTLVETEVRDQVDVCLSEPVRMDTIYDALERITATHGLINRGAATVQHRPPHPTRSTTLRHAGWRPLVDIEQGLERSVAGLRHG